jgi:two-component system cell cycle response regulator
LSIEEKTPKILIVDDEEINVELMEAYLLSEPYTTITAYGGKEALRKVREEKPDMVLLDVMMPEVDGYEVCRLLKADSETQFTPVLMLTALSELEHRIRGIDVGADDFLTKPINKLELTTRVKSLLRVKDLHDKLAAERDSLEVKNRIQSILTEIIPTLLQAVSYEEKNIMINQMTGMVQKTLIDMYSFDLEDIDLAYTGKICEDIMNQLGGDFSSKTDDEGTACIIEGTACPWGKEHARRNPILCTLTRKIFSNVASKMPGRWGVEVYKTIGNRNECCYFRIKEIG